MSKYRISVSFDGENFFWIVVDKGKFIRNPTKEDLADTKIRYYNKTNICFRCRKDNKIIDSSILYPGQAYREYDENEKKTGRWLCHSCWKITDYVKRQDSHYGIIRSMAKCRTRTQDPYSEQAKGDNFEELTDIWKGAKRLSIENNRYCGPLDHSIDSEGTIYQTKGKFYNFHNQYWNQNVENEWDKEYDYLIFYCTSKNGKDIERIYIFPKSEIDTRKSITIYKNPSQGSIYYDSKEKPYISGWYEKYRISDEETIKRVNKTWKKIIGRKIK